MLYFASLYPQYFMPQSAEKGVIKIHFDCRPTMSVCWTQVLIGWKI